MPKSTLLEEMDGSGKEITTAQARFETWLTEKGYDLAVNGAPHDSREGGYQGAIDAEDLLADYLGDHDEDEYEEELTQHCYELGPLFNPDKWHFE
jgi:hypothetical protein